MNHSNPVPRARQGLRRVCTAILALSLCAPLLGQLDVRSDGSDGVFSPSAAATEVVIDLGRCVTGEWNRTISAEERLRGATPWGVGVYDAERWALVFKYERVHIPKGVTVRFRNHPSRAPVVWLVRGDVRIEGTLDLSGAVGAIAPAIAEPGPGGFRGGAGFYTADVLGSCGWGPGGGEFGNPKDGRDASGGGSFGTAGQASGEAPGTYGSARLIPLMGGSGGGGSRGQPWGGGAGGGGILIAATGEVRVDGLVKSNGGGVTKFNDHRTAYSIAGGCGAGGAVRIVCNLLSGSGRIEAVGGSGRAARSGGQGRIRLEYARLEEGDGELLVTPSPSVAKAAPRPELWARGDDGTKAAPRLRVASVGSKAPRADPRASFGAGGPDVVVTDDAEVEVVIEGEQVDRNTQVMLRVGPRTGACTWHVAKYDAESSSGAVGLWKATVVLPLGVSALQVKAILP